MKISVYTQYDFEYPDDIVVCLNNFTVEDLKELLNDIIDMSSQGQSIVLSDKSYITYSDCILTLELSDNDVGIIKVSEQEYRCLLNKDSYMGMYSLVEYFIQSGIDSGYQWLYDKNNSIEFLLSNSGQW